MNVGRRATGAGRAALLTAALSLPVTPHAAYVPYTRLPLLFAYPQRPSRTSSSRAVHLLPPLLLRCCRALCATWLLALLLTFLTPLAVTVSLWLCSLFGYQGQGGLAPALDAWCAAPFAVTDHCPSGPTSPVTLYDRKVTLFYRATCYYSLWMVTFRRYCAVHCVTCYRSPRLLTTRRCAWPPLTCCYYCWALATSLHLWSARTVLHVWMAVVCFAATPAHPGICRRRR